MASEPQLRDVQAGACSWHVLLRSKVLEEVVCLCYECAYVTNVHIITKYFALPVMPWVNYKAEALSVNSKAF